MPLAAGQARRVKGALAAACAVALLGAAAAPAEAAPSFLWPAYKYPVPSDPADTWARAIATGGGQSFIVNPASGPGTAVDANYRTVIARARAAGIPLAGYVHTSYGARSLTAVRTDINRWQTLYGITSIFLDEAAARVSSRGNDRRLITYYRQLFTYIRGRGGTVTLNPGVVPDQEYLTAADTIVTFEGSAAAYRGASFPRWTLDAANARIAHIVYGASGAESSALVTRAHALGAGHISVTDDVLPNPYDSLPSYYEAERQQLRGLS